MASEVERFKPTKTNDKLILIGFIILIIGFLFQGIYEKPILLSGFGIAIVFAIMPNRDFTDNKYEGLYICGMVLLALFINIGLFILE